MTDPAEIVRLCNEWRRYGKIGASPFTEEEEGQAVDLVLLRLHILEKYKRVMEVKL